MLLVLWNKSNAWKWRGRQWLNNNSHGLYQTHYSHTSLLSFSCLCNATTCKWHWDTSSKQMEWWGRRWGGHQWLLWLVSTLHYTHSPSLVSATTWKWHYEIRVPRKQAWTSNRWKSQFRCENSDLWPKKVLFKIAIHTKSTRPCPHHHLILHCPALSLQYLYCYILVVLVERYVIHFLCCSVCFIVFYMIINTI